MVRRQVKWKVGVWSGWVWGCGSRSDSGRVCLAAEKVFKYSIQTRSGPINGKSFFDDSEICHARLWAIYRDWQDWKWWKLRRHEAGSGNVDDWERAGVAVREDGGEGRLLVNHFGTYTLLALMYSAVPFSHWCMFLHFSAQIALAVAKQSDRGKDKEDGWQETNVGRNEKWEMWKESRKRCSLHLSKERNQSMSNFKKKKKIFTLICSLFQYLYTVLSIWCTTQDDTHSFQYYPELMTHIFCFQAW